nr:unnamed protein product [Callosobruchus chinensis]
MKTVIFSRKGLRFHKRRLESMSFFGVNDSYKLPRQECDDSTYDLIIRYYVQVTDSSKRLGLRTKLNMKSKTEAKVYATSYTDTRFQALYKIQCTSIRANMHI